MNNIATIIVPISSSYPIAIVEYKLLIDIYCIISIVYYDYHDQYENLKD